MEQKVKEFIISVRLRSRAEMNVNGSSRKSVKRLIIQMTDALENKKLRNHVLAAITGLPITSQNQLTQGSTSILIDETNDGKSNEILRAIEEVVAAGFAKDPIHFRPCTLFQWEHPSGK
jgi:hypothetical protein